jgi:hypothetical protein
VKIQLLIAAPDGDYAGHLADTLSSRHSDTFEVGVCLSQETLRDALASKKYDAVLVEPEWAPALREHGVKLVLALWSEQSPPNEAAASALMGIRKYQRISALVGDVLGHYADLAAASGGFDKDGGKIVAVWAPAGGVGKTSVALAFATRTAADGSGVSYLGLEHFSGAGAYFANQGKSVSVLFEKIGTNAEILAKSIRLHDDGSGIYYFNPPENYDDVNELTRDDLTALVNVCSRISDVTVVDLPSVCDKRIQTVFELADTVLLVTDGGKTSAAKLDIFVSQHNAFENIRSKTRLVSNKGAKLSDDRFEGIVSLPLVQSPDPVVVYKTLSGSSFGDITRQPQN